MSKASCEAAGKHRRCGFANGRGLSGLRRGRGLCGLQHGRGLSGLQHGLIVHFPLEYSPKIIQSADHMAQISPPLNREKKRTLLCYSCTNQHRKSRQEAEENSIHISPGKIEIYFPKAFSYRKNAMTKLIP